MSSVKLSFYSVHKATHALYLIQKIFFSLLYIIASYRCFKISQFICGAVIFSFPFLNKYQKEYEQISDLHRY